LNGYAKLWAALSAAIILTVKASHGGFTADEIDLLTVAWLGVVAVWFFPNQEGSG
jgi:hypothetical protein